MIPILGQALHPVPAEGQRSAVRDSSGVAIVEVVGGEDVEAVGWSVSREARMTIGVIDGPSELLLNGVSGATRLSDGRIVILDGGTKEVRIFGGDGRFQRRFGRGGQGPGEFQQPYLAGVLEGDTLLVVDFQLRRISRFDPDSGFLGSLRISDPVTHPAIPRGMFADGTMVVGGAYSWSEGDEERVRGGYLRPTTAYQAMGEDGELLAELGEFPGGEFHATIHRLPGGRPSMSVELVPFSRHPVVAVGPRFFHVGFREAWEVRAFDSRGRLLRITRVDRPLSPVTRQDVEGELQRRSEGDPDQERELRRLFAEMEIPATMPAFGSMAVDGLGFLWVSRFRRPRDDQFTVDLFQPRGPFIGSITLPPYRRILDIGEDYILLLHVDDLGVETVGLHDLRRPSSH